MRCPIDNETLVMADRSGVEIDYCPKCRGVWLDRGELDKIIERAANAAPAMVVPNPAERPAMAPVAPMAPAAPMAPREMAQPERSSRYRDDDDYDDDRKRKGYRKRESFLGDLFDF